MKKNWLIFAGAAAAAGLVAIDRAVVGEAAFSLTSRRQAPFKEIIRKKREEYIAPPADRVQEMNDGVVSLKETPMETVYVKSHDGLTLVGHWYPAENPKRTVIMFHGWRSTWYHDFGMSADFMHDSGCNLLYIEQRSHSGSEGDYILYGILERYDAQTWVDFAVGRNPENLPIYLCGISMGATTVLMASDLPLKYTVKGIIADSGYTSAEEIIKVMIKQNAPFLPTTHVYNCIDRACRNHTGFSYSEFTAPKALKRCTVPVLFIHGEDDGFVPVSMTYENYEACASEKELLVVPGAHHGTSYAVDTPKYQETILEFFDKHDN